jgi:hypothetical protein
MQKLSIADYFKKELEIKHNSRKLKEIQKYEKDSYYLKLEKQVNGREGLSLYYEGDKGLTAFLEDYLELFDPNIASAQNTVIAVDGKIRDLINNSSEELDNKIHGEEKYSLDEIRAMYSEFVKLDELFLPKYAEISKWLKLRKIFKK